MASRINTTTDQFVTATQDAFNQLDVHRSEQLAFTNKLLALKDKAQQKEKERLTKKYGADHPEVKRIEARLAFNQELFPAVEANIKQSNIPTEPFVITTWRVYGFVYDANGRPLEKITVLFLDEKEQPIRTLPYACTDSNGYYAITLTKEQLPDPKTALLLGVTLPSQKKPVVASKEPLYATAGLMVYREIVLGAATCEPPFPATEGSK